MEVKKKFYDPFLGAVMVETDESGVSTTKFIKSLDVDDEDDKRISDDFIMRESGLEKLWQRNHRLSSAISDPKKFLEGKNNDIRLIGVDLNRVYTDEVKRLIGLGYPNDKARDMAKERMMHEKKRRLEVHEQEWPISIEKLVVKKLGNPLK